MVDLVKFTDALAQSEATQPVFQALRDLACDVLDLRLFTVMTFNLERKVSQRIYTDNPDAYPVGGEKQVMDTACTRSLLVEKKAFVGNTIEDLATVFPDWEKIQSLGLESCLNLPIVVDGKTLGSLNGLSIAGHFTPERIAAAEQLRLPGAATFLLARQSTGLNS